MKNLSINIEIRDTLGLDHPFTSNFRSIQTDDRELAEQLFKDVITLIDKYENRGAYIGR